MKTNLILKTSVVLLLTIIISGCSKYSDKDLYGTWTRSETEEVEEDDGSVHQLETINSLKIEGDRLINSCEVFIDGNQAIKLSVEGRWTYDEADLIRSEAVGVIIIKYDPDTFHHEFDEDMYDEDDMNDMIKDWETYISDWNKNTERVELFKNNHVKKYYGIYLFSVDGNELKVEEDGEALTYTKKS